MSETAAPAQDIVTKSEFARLANVDKSRVSQWLAAGQISGDAIVGEGRAARIHVERAKAQLRLKLDFSQRLGNGLDTRLDGGPTRADFQPPEAWRPAPTNPVEEEIKRERLAALQASNRRQTEDDLARRGLYLRTEAVKADMTKLALALLNVFEGSMPDLASAVASRFEMPQRDVLHTLRRAFREVREKAALEAAKRSSVLPALLVDDVADATDPAQGEA